MTEALTQWAADLDKQVEDMRREVVRLQDRMGVLSHVRARLADILRAETPPPEPAPDATGTTERQRRDVRGNVLAVLMENFATHLGVGTIHTLVQGRIGDIPESALARSLVTLVRDGKVVENNGRFTLVERTPQPNMRDAEMIVGAALRAEAAK